MKKLFNNSLFMFILGALIFGSIGTILALDIIASEIEYLPKYNTWNVSNLQGAINDLYDMATCANATSNDIVDGKTALVNGTVVTGTYILPNYTELSGSTNILPGKSTTTITGNYKLTNYNVSCSACQLITYIDPDATFDVVYTKSSNSATITKTYTLNGVEKTDTDVLAGDTTHNLGGITISRAQVGGAVGHTITIKNNSDSKILYNGTYYEPGETIKSHGKNSDDFRGTFYMSKLY